MVLGYRQNCQNWIKTFISFFCSVVLLFMFPLLLYVISLIFWFENYFKVFGPVEKKKNCVIINIIIITYNIYNLNTQHNVKHIL